MDKMTSAMLQNIWQKYAKIDFLAILRKAYFLTGKKLWHKKKDRHITLLLSLYFIIYFLIFYEKRYIY